MQKKSSDAVVQHERDVGADPQFNLLVVMRLKDDRDAQRKSKQAASHPSNRDEFLRLGTKLRPVFETRIGFHLFLSGEIIKGDLPLDVIDVAGPQFVNLWGIKSPGQIPMMMNKLLNPPDKSELYGQLDDLVAQEVQDAMRVYPVIGRVPKARRGKKLLYVALTLFPESSDIAGFYGRFSVATKEAKKDRAEFRPLISLFSMTGLLNRIVQFWSLEIEAGADEGKAVELIERQVAKLDGWYSKAYRRQDPAILRPTPWDVTIMKKLHH